MAQYSEAAKAPLRAGWYPCRFLVQIGEIGFKPTLPCPDKKHWSRHIGAAVDKAREMRRCHVAYFDGYEFSRFESIK